MVPFMIDPSASTRDSQENGDHHQHHHHSENHRCACQTLKELGMIHYEPSLNKCETSRSAGYCPQHETPLTKDFKRNSSNHAHNHHDHDPDHKCACHTLKELGMVWHEPLPKKSASIKKSEINKEPATMTVELHGELHKKVTVEDVLAETVKELKLGRESIHQRFLTTPLYKTLESSDDVPNEYPNLQKTCMSKKKAQKQDSTVPGSRYVSLPSTSHQDQNEIDLDLTEVKVPFDRTEKIFVPENDKNNKSFDPFSTPEVHHYNLQAESHNDKNHMQSVKGINDNKSNKNVSKKAGNNLKKPKTPKHKRSFKQRAERKFRKFTVPKGYHKLREEDVDDDIMKMEQDLNMRKERRKQLKKVTPTFYLVHIKFVGFKKKNSFKLLWSNIVSAKCSRMDDCRRNTSSEANEQFQSSTPTVSPTHFPSSSSEPPTSLPTKEP